MLVCKLKRYCYGTIALAILQAVVVLCTPLGNLYGTVGQRALSYILAGVFWASFMGEFILIYCAEQIRKKLEQKREHKKVRRRTLPGVFCFFTSRLAMIADMVCLLSVILLLLFSCFEIGHSFALLLFFAFFLLSFHLHSILNGKIYRCIKNI